jgi:hypothetical protein
MTDGTNEDELLRLQIETADLKSQLDILLAAVRRLESASDIRLRQPAGQTQMQMWQSAGLPEEASFPEVCKAMEDWVFSQPNYKEIVASAGGWLSFLHSLIADQLEGLATTQN